MNLLESFKAKLNEAAGNAPKDGRRCVVCRQPFSDQNVFTELGWKETHISGTCEKCWDTMFKEDES